MSQGFRGFQRLTARVLLYLTIALVPFGAIGIWQSQRINSESDQRARLALLALTEQAASGERRLIDRAFGAAEVLGVTSLEQQENPAECSAAMRAFQGSDDRYAFIGFLPLNGLVDCSTADQPLDFRRFAQFNELMQNPKPFIGVNNRAPGSGKAVMIINQPHYRDGNLAGFMTLSLPLAEVAASADVTGPSSPLSLITFNSEGEVLSTQSNTAASELTLPADRALADLTLEQAETFSGLDESGTLRDFAVIPLIPGTAYALGSWEAGQGLAASPMARAFHLFLPVAMWLASLLVAWYVLDRFVMSRISRLDRGLRKFAKTRALPTSSQSTNSPQELRQLQESFEWMAQTVLEQEAEQSRRLDEKSILLKEIHHRINNNLQIISSLMNLQMRKAEAEETRNALQHIQERILGLSGVHHALFQAGEQARIKAHDIIGHIAEETQRHAKQGAPKLDLSLAVEDIDVSQDQAIPLALLVSEIMNDVLKTAATAHDEAPRLSISMWQETEKDVHLSISSSFGETPQDTSDDFWSNLGQKMIESYARQLGGQLVETNEGDLLRLDVNFTLLDFKAAPVDY